MDIEPLPALMGGVAAILGWVMAASMKAGFVIKVITTMLCLVAGYFISYKISEN